MAVFTEWRSVRNARPRSSDSTPIPDGELVDWPVQTLNCWLPLFLHEIRRRDGKDYRAKTLFEYLLTIQSAFSVTRGISYRFLRDEQFLPIKNALDNRMRSLQGDGLGNNLSWSWSLWKWRRLSGVETICVGAHPKCCFGPSYISLE